MVILCGGRGTRLQEHTQSIPKPLVEIGGKPILWHVVRIYAAAGYRRFVLCLGYRGDMIAEFVEAETWPDGVTFDAIDTGTDTPTGGRIHAVGDRLSGGAFCATYGDGVADIDLGSQADFHRDHGATATVTVVQPTLQFGVAELNGDGVVRGFTEKPQLDRWINGGFFRFEPAVLDRLEPDSVLERGPLESLAADGELRGFRHEGFWDCMDTYKDAVALNDRWSEQSAPWKVWE